MLRRTFLATVLSTAALLAVSLSLVACGGGGGGDPLPPPPPTTGISFTNSATDSAAQPNTHSILGVTLIPFGGVQTDIVVNIAPGATFLVGLAPGQYRLYSARYDDSAVLGPILPPLFFTLAAGDTPPYTAVRPGAP